MTAVSLFLGIKRCYQCDISSQTKEVFRDEFDLYIKTKRAKKIYSVYPIVWRYCMKVYKCISKRVVGNFEHEESFSFIFDVRRGIFRRSSGDFQLQCRNKKAIKKSQL
jgi:hypothetical protein